MMSRGMVFYTEKGNPYFYNDLNGEVSPLSKDILIEKEIIYEEEKEEHVDFNKNDLKEFIENYGYK